MSDLQQFQKQRPMKLSTAVTLMVCSVVIPVLLVVFTLYFIQLGRATHDGVKQTALAVARTLADSPEVRRGLGQSPQNNMIPHLAHRVEQRNGLLYAVVTDMRGIRYTHPNPELIGKRFIGDDLTPALQGKENIAVNRGVLAQALRAFTPVYDEQHRQVGVVIVGLSLSGVAEQINHSRWNILWALLFSILLGALGIWALVRVLKRILFGLEPYGISRLFEQRQAMLHSLKEGVIAVDARGRVSLINHAARQMLLSTSANDAHAPLLDGLKQVLTSGQAQQDREVNDYGRLLLSNTVPVRSNNRIIGAICTFRDKTEIDRLTQRLDGMVNYVDALRAHSHEFMNKLHVILGLLHMKRYDKLEQYVIQTASHYQTDIGAIQRQIRSPVVAGFLLGKIGRARDAGHSLTLAEESRVPDNPNEQQVATLVTVLGNLIENALDAMADQAEGEIGLLLHYQNGWLNCEVSDDGPGIGPRHIESIFNKGYSTKGHNRGVGLFLARQQLESLGGTLSVESEPGVFTQFFAQIPWNSERSST
jgi:two-component system sensor histidine kinase DcuS